MRIWKDQRLAERLLGGYPDARDSSGRLLSPDAFERIVVPEIAAMYGKRAVPPLDNLVIEV